MREISTNLFILCAVIRLDMSSSDLPDGVDQETAARLLRRVLEAEQNKLYMENPMGIKNDIREIIEEEIE